jgi:hypothetical protein
MERRAMQSQMSWNNVPIVNFVLLIGVGAEAEAGAKAKACSGAEVGSLHTTFPYFLRNAIN